MFAYNSIESPRGEYAGGIVASKTKPQTKRLSEIPKGQTKKHIKRIRKEYNAYIKTRDEKPFGYDRAQRHLDNIAALCVQGGPLSFALRGDCMPASWARHLLEATWAASIALPLPGRKPCEPNTRLGNAINDLAEAERDRIHWMHR